MMNDVDLENGHGNALALILLLVVLGVGFLIGLAVGIVI